MLMSIRTPSAKRRLIGILIFSPLLAVLMLSILSMDTSAFDTPVTDAMAALKVDCVPSSKSESVKGSDTASVTTKELAVMASGGGAEEELPDEDVQGPPSGPEKPALQVQAVETELPSRESEFVGHSKHVEGWLAPTDAEYVPISQSIHASDPARALYFPVTHSKHVSL